MNELKNVLAPHHIGQAETYYEWKQPEIDINVYPEPPEWEICAMPSKWTPANWKWFLEQSWKITINLQESI